MNKNRNCKKKRKSVRFPWLILVFAVIVIGAAVFVLSSDSRPKIRENDSVTYGIDVARYQGTVDWEEVSRGEVDFAMVRLGYRSMEDGSITEDVNARYNLQEAQKYGIPMGGYFFSTAISEEEAREEARWVAELVSRYAITYPIAYDCEGFTDPESRQYTLTKRQRTDFALAFLKTIEELGYEGMFYASRNDLQGNSKWDTHRIEKDYKIWVAQYPETVDPVSDKSSYSGEHHMWQYTASGTVPGINGSVDKNVAYFGYDGIREPQNSEPPEPAKPNVEAQMTFTPVDEQVTAKVETNLRDAPSQGDDSTPLYLLKNGEIARRIGISDSGWSKVEFNGTVYYAVSSYLTNDLGYYEIKTPFQSVNELVTPKIEVNLRNIPSTESEDSRVVVLLKHGQVATRTGINTDVGWSRVIWEGQTLYCVSSYLEAAE